MRVLIVDDEPLARRRLHRLLRSADITVIGEAYDVASAVAEVRQMRPDVMLLDVQMPGGDGFDVVETLADVCPATIFVTAFDHHALRAFDIAAVDYLTKPVDQSRLSIALDRARRFIEEKSREEHVAELLLTVDVLRQALRTVKNTSPSFWVKSKGISIRVGIETIDFIRAERDYVHLHANGQSYMVSENLSSISQRLDKHGFLRIHRGTIVRIDAVESVHKGRYGKMYLRTRAGADLSVGRSYMSTVIEKINSRHGG
jgi:two-component system, LytTR family, response regulator